MSTNTNVQLDNLSFAEQKLFALLEQLATAGERCPSNQELSGMGYTPGRIPQLARRGFIRIDIYPKNQRIITILVGRARGKSTTLPDAPSGYPMRTIDRHGDSQVRSQSETRAHISLPTPPWETGEVG